LGDLLDRAFRLYRAGFVRLVLTAAVVLVPVSVVSGIATGRFVTGYIDALGLILGDSGQSAPGVGDFLGQVVGGGALVILISLVASLLTGVVTLALTVQTVDLLHDRPISVGGALRQGVGRLLSYIWMVIVQSGAIFLVSLAVLLPIFLAIFLIFALVGALGFGFAGAFEEAGVILAIGFVLLILVGYLLLALLILMPTLFLSARWVVAVPALMAEGLGGVPALRRSWRLTKGHFWRALGYLVLLYLLTSVVAGLPVYVVQQFLVILLPTSAFGLGLGISSAFSSLFSVVWTPFFTCALVLLYYDLRVRAEAYDLHLRLQQAEATLPEATLPEPSPGPNP
jgi:membrane-anchored glycerophosphoryl diester phosphodiesterase (GDPDase)